VEAGVGHGRLLGPGLSPDEQRPQTAQLASLRCCLCMAPGSRSSPQSPCLAPPRRRMVGPFRNRHLGSLGFKERGTTMNAAKHHFSRVGFLKIFCLLAVSAMGGCVNNDDFATCGLVGSRVVIPSSDTTDPAVVLDFHLPDGQIVSVSSSSASPSSVTASSNGTVTLFAKASDDQGIRDVQLWIGTTTCSIDPSSGSLTCSGPTSGAAPTASNRDTRGPGETGCTERLVQHNLVVSYTPTSSTSHGVSARGVNFGGREVRIGVIRLQAQ
jgi:hypothetical protein